MKGKLGILGGVSKLLKYQQTLLFVCLGLVLWTTIGLQFIAHDTPCPRCWEVRGVYLIILQLLLYGMVFGYQELLSIGIIVLFTLAGNFITVRQLITHASNVAEGKAHAVGYGAYASFLGLSLPQWNEIICGFAIVYICSINYFQHRLGQSQYVCGSKFSRCLAITWALSLFLVQAGLFFAAPSPTLGGSPQLISQ